MSTRPPLRVRLYGRHVADLADVGFGDTALTYTAGALEAPSASRLSLSLPVRAEQYPAVGPGGRWVRSLLPEGRALAWAVQHFGIPEDDRYALIGELGSDVAGAVEVLPEGAGSSEGGHYEPLSGDELASLVGRAHTVGLGLDRSRGVRLSLAGMQDKLLLHEHAPGQFSLPVRGAASTVIVKPEPPEADAARPGVAGVATNELFCLTLARECGLDTAAARMERFGEMAALVVVRYDRDMTRPPGAPVGRIHQEDLLGALGLDPLLKYERPQQQRHTPAGGFAPAEVVTARGGPDLVALAGLLDTHLGRARLATFLQAVAFNIAVGNADAHARNYSVLLPPDGAPRLAPLYDVICTRYWPHLDSEAAQLVAGEDAIDKVSVEHLTREAARWGLTERLARSRVLKVLEAAAAHIDRAVEGCVASGGDPDVAEAVAGLVRTRVRRLLDGARSAPASTGTRQG